MARNVTAGIQEHFADLTDPRRRKVIYPLINIVTIALCAVISGADDFVSMALWARTKKKWLAKFLDQSAGIPSHDRFNAVLAAIKPAEFQQCLLSWITALHEISDGQLVAVDGKTLRRSSGTAAAAVVGRQRQVGHPHGQPTNLRSVPGHGQPDHPGTSRRRRPA